MNTIKSIGALLLFCLSASVMAEMRIAVVDLNAAGAKSDEFRLRGEKFKSSIGQEEADLMSLGKAIQKLEEKRNKDAAVMGADEMRKLDQEINDKKLEGNFKKQKLQQKVADANQEMQRIIEPKMQQAMKSIVDEKKYDLILRREAVVWAIDTVDLTDELTKRINSQK